VTLVTSTSSLNSVSLGTAGPTERSEESKLRWEILRRGAPQNDMKLVLLGTLDSILVSPR
jgi:hypothetical protein